MFKFMAHLGITEKKKILCAIKNNLNYIQKNSINLRSTLRKSKILADGREAERSHKDTTWKVQENEIVPQRENSIFYSGKLTVEVAQKRPKIL